MKGALMPVHPAGWLRFLLTSKFQDQTNHKDKQAVTKPTTIREATSVEKSLDLLLSFKDTSLVPTAECRRLITFRPIESN